MTPPIRRLVLDVLKPHEPDIAEFARSVADHATVDAVNAVLVETDRKVETIKLTIQGTAVDLPAIGETIETLGGSIHSIDEVVCGEALTEQSPTPQDR
ncbi:hypothetical protein Halru_1313 [Halovivax ruber XH-70]|uniref:DUF211 domain-containing protein n=1 Tax=Halovivax ruber (strain DSM 18193 / JCM 13892 / XH-70) TaxID=797302 RepID=L0ICI4_HALRX|nr:DUF211 domain-containing protein [Halovivax ruber]AGB15926.1 hypothetical protein Halru_1313 [Halovivax ruber XH-70]